jgi:hypothetical protein
MELEGITEAEAELPEVIQEGIVTPKPIPTKYARRIPAGIFVNGHANMLNTQTPVDIVKST